jgi:hypothetical protein
MNYINKCSCGNNQFFVHTEKFYEGEINCSGKLECQPEEQHIKEIKCKKCSKLFAEKHFREIDY